MQKGKCIRRITAAAALCGVLLAQPLYHPPQAEAGILGSVISGAAQYNELLKQLDYYDKQPEGREAVYQTFVKEYGIGNDPTGQAILDDMIPRLSKAIATVKKDKSVNERPYKYFITQSEDYNAACSMGHVMFIHPAMFHHTGYNEHELAFILGHEMGHGQMGHVVGGAKANFMGSAAISAMTGGTLGGAILGGLAKMTFQNKVVTAAHEKEADAYAWDITVAAGYNIGSGAAAMENICRYYREHNMDPSKDSLTNNHPVSQTRRDRYSKKMTEFSNNIVKVDANTAEITIRGKHFSQGQCIRQWQQHPMRGPATDYDAVWCERGCPYHPEEHSVRRGARCCLIRYRNY